jgi:uncharacterized membrane protein
MIPKGNLHADGAKLADYLTTGKDGERAELAELRGFASSSIHEAFADVEIQSLGTDCEKPFFHTYVRLPKGEHLTRERWLYTADRIEKKLGFTDQPRAVAFHHSPDGETHMHIGWSRIDTENMCAIDPGLFKKKLKEVARELEVKLDLTRVSNERAPEHKTLSATRNEFEESRRLKTDLREIRETIRDCWDRSDNGHSFTAALEEKGMQLARGDKRDFVIVDQEGGIHALSKRITGATAQQTRARLADIDRAELPSVDQARAQQIERQLAVLEKEKTVERNIGREQPAAEKPEQKPLGRAAGDVHLAYTLSESARGFIEALEDRGLRLARASAQDVALNEHMRAGYQQFLKDHPELVEQHNIKEPLRIREGELLVVSLFKDEPRLCFLNERTTGDQRDEIQKFLGTLHEGNLPDIKGATHDLREAKEREAAGKTAERSLGKTAGEIRLAYELSRSAEEFVEGLEGRGLKVARVHLRDVQQNLYEREHAEQFGLRPPAELHLDELVIVNRYGSVYFINERTTGDSRDEIAKYLSSIDQRGFPSVHEARQEQTRAREVVHDPELDHKYIHELRELRDELKQTRSDLREQLANEELSPNQRGALEEQRAEAGNRLMDVRSTIKEMCEANPMLARNEFAFRTAQSQDMSLEDRALGLVHSVSQFGKDLGDIASGIADFAVRLFDTVVDFFITPSLPTPEIIHARREAREESAEAAIDWKRYKADAAYRDQTDQQDRLQREQDAQREYSKKREHELHPNERERER